jgi:hypothetical protein
VTLCEDDGQLDWKVALPRVDSGDPNGRAFNKDLRKWLGPAAMSMSRRAALGEAEMGILLLG